MLILGTSPIRIRSQPMGEGLANRSGAAIRMLWMNGVGDRVNKICDKI